MIEFALTLILITLSLAGLGVGLLLGRSAPIKACATANLSADGSCGECACQCEERPGR